jgi:hypothetical protein
MDYSSFRTSDLPLAGALCVLGFMVEEVEKVNPKRSVFIFDNSKELEKAVNDYWAGRLTVEPQKYFYQLKNLKARIYQNRV